MRNETKDITFHRVTMYRCKQAPYITHGDELQMKACHACNPPKPKAPTVANKLERIILDELSDGKYRGPSIVSVPYDLEWTLVHDVMTGMVRAGILEENRGRYRIKKASSGDADRG